MGSQRRQYARKFVADLLGPNVQSLSSAAAWNLLKQCVTTQLLLSSRSVATFIGEAQVPNSIEHAANELSSIETVINGVYRALGFEVESTVPGEIIDLLLSELGLPVEGQAADADEGSSLSGQLNDIPSVWIEKAERNDLRFLEVAVVKDAIVLKFNDRHPAFCGSSELKAVLLQPSLWLSFGEACRAQLGMLEEVQTFLDSWGVHLAVAVRKGKS